MYVNESGTLHFLWNQTGTQGRVWHKITLDYGASEQYQVCHCLPLTNLQRYPNLHSDHVRSVLANHPQLVFEAKRPPRHGGVIALDDIYIRESVSCADSIVTTLAPTTHPTTPPVSSMDCTFEEGEK